MRIIAFAKRNMKEILREPLNLKVKNSPSKSSFTQDLFVPLLQHNLLNLKIMCKISNFFTITIN